MGLEQLHELLYAVGWGGFHPSDYDPTDEQMLALVARVRRDAILDVCKYLRSFPMSEHGVRRHVSASDIESKFLTMDERPVA